MGPGARTRMVLGMDIWNGVAGNVVFGPSATTLLCRAFDQIWRGGFAKTGWLNPNGEPGPAKIPNGNRGGSQMTVSSAVNRAAARDLDRRFDPVDLGYIEI